MKRLTTIAMSLMLFLTTSVCESADWGTYHGTVQTEWVTDDERDMRLLSDFHYTGPRPSAIRWTAPTGAVVNGASIPPVFWPIIGSPFTGRYRNASVLHDVACDEKRRSWEEVHLMFYQAMRRSGVSVTKAKTMYWAVYHFGIRWRAPNAVERVFGVRGTEVRSSRVPEAPSSI